MIYLLNYIAALAVSGFAGGLFIYILLLGADIATPSDAAPERRRHMEMLDLRLRRAAAWPLAVGIAASVLFNVIFSIYLIFLL